MSKLNFYRDISVFVPVNTRQTIITERILKGRHDCTTLSDKLDEIHQSKSRIEMSPDDSNNTFPRP